MSLQAPIKDLLTDPVEHEGLERIRRRIHETRHSRKPGSSRWTAAAVAAAALLVFVGTAGYLAVPSAVGPEPVVDVGPLRLANGTIFAGVSAQAPERVAFSDGSAVVLSAGTVLEALENGAEQVVLTQSEGDAAFGVRPGGPRRWVIDAGLATVHVIGTRFRITRTARQLRVSVTRGTVEVRGARVAGGSRQLGRGQDITITLLPPASGPPAPSVPAVLEPPANPGRERRAPPSWRALAQSGAYRDAYDEIGTTGLRMATLRSSSVDELFALADTARLSDHAVDAVAPLDRIVADFPEDRRSGIAAFTLGRLHLETFRSPRDAERAFRIALSLGVPRHLHEATLARLVEASLRAGHEEHAAEVAARYLHEYPHGRSTERVRRAIPSGVHPEPTEASPP